ncbi:phospholipase A1 2-like [Cydia pomonella]|uniref:phospholipase A1 2-like n=1 Tax=Cydia pomonella TaxID=82600 RepID=UPI002ADE3073|nr:phospholipase A1 2-like [Cydia pomonella]
MYLRLVSHCSFGIVFRGLSNYIKLNAPAQQPNRRDTTRLLSNKQVKLVTHGWISSAEDGMVTSIKNAYLRSKDVAVIAVDWSDTANDYNYPFVAKSIRKVGAHVGQFLNVFCELYNISGDRLHLIGHSLGAHLMGIAASKTNVRVGRVTGLDPARPLFDSCSLRVFFLRFWCPPRRGALSKCLFCLMVNPALLFEYPKVLETLSLSSSVAVFVDVIHTCGGALGIQDNSGHADFYPNGGKSPQPGCDIPEPCSHSRAHMYFSESIDNPTGFPACRSKHWTEHLNSTECKQQTYMGENADRNSKGQYYLKTNAKAPFAINNPKLRSDS